MMRSRRGHFDDSARITFPFDSATRRFVTTHTLRKQIKPLLVRFRYGWGAVTELNHNERYIGLDFLAMVYSI